MTRPVRKVLSANQRIDGEYLGDAVYIRRAAHKDDCFILTVENGVFENEVIVMELETLWALQHYLQCRGVFATPSEGLS